VRHPLTLIKTTVLEEIRNMTKVLHQGFTLPKRSLPKRLVNLKRLLKKLLQEAVRFSSEFRLRLEWQTRGIKVISRKEGFSLPPV